MKENVNEIKRIVAGYSKTPNKSGNCPLEVEYDLKSIELSFLQKLFNIDPNDADPGVRDIIDCYQINQVQAKALQPFVIDGLIDLEKYDFMLECYQEG